MSPYRDLLWALFSPQLINPSPKFKTVSPPNRRQTATWLKTIKTDLDPLMDTIAQVPGKRLGLYYESLWKFFFETNPNFKLYFHNQQIYNDHQTLGAFDFIYQDPSQQIIHRECAVKFYLGIPKTSDSVSELSAWWGPNKKDRFDLKWNRLLDSQIQLSEKQEAKDFLQQHQLTINAKEIDLKGMLFYPWHRAMQPPKQAQRNHLKGYWLELKDFERLSHSCWIMLPRMQWLARAKPKLEETADPKTFHTMLLNHFSQSQQPCMVAALTPHQDYGFELCRYFVTPNQWHKEFYE